MEESQPITVDRPLEQSDNCLNEVEGSGSTTLYGSVITMLLCWMTAAIIYSSS